MNRRFFAELLTVLSVQMVDKDELGSDECLIGDVLVKFKVIHTSKFLIRFNTTSKELCIGVNHQSVYLYVKDMAGGGLFIPKSDVQKLAIDGDLTMSRRGSTLVTAPSCISLHDKTTDILSDLGAPDGGKDEEKKES